MKVAICDDDSHVFDRIKSLFESVYEGEKQYYEFSDTNALEKSMADTSYDILFLDIDFGDFKGREEGIRLKNRLSERNEDVFIIFVTSHYEYIEDSFGKNVIGFLDKAHLDDETGRSRLARIIKQNKQRMDPGVPLEMQGRIVYSREIVLFKTEGRYCRAFMVDGNSYLLNDGIGYWKKQVPLNSYYCNLHSCLVNCEYVDGRKGNTVIMQNGMEVRLPKGKVREFDEKLIASKKLIMKVL